ncbi:hypothetical protein [Myxococcus sp. SDU36]|uniref:hypothetical protein n=1 Tax=Myxococcus sp. SDU36 TaxID=2831967 RepID=UPI002542E9D2|nr:hypothetical protein [Myxococcus sp. SDU36]WIG93257.1 hypothetical protein KGD87_21935 [Myxococcus sp. SDU36]
MSPARSTVLGLMLLGALLLLPSAAAARTVLLQKDGQWQLQVDGRPYIARGVTFSGSGNSTAYDVDCARLAALGVNTLRTWGTGSETRLLLDADHPVISVDAWTLAVPWWEKHVPSLDAYGLNVYGGGIHALPAALAQAGVKKPWFITEFGAQGEWDAPRDAHGVPREPTDAEKYAAIVDGWNTALAPHVKAGRCLGLFVFNFGASFDHTGLWLGMLSGSSTRPAWWAVREAFTGQKPSTPLPRIDAVAVQGAVREGPTTWALVHVDVADSDPKRPGVSFAYNFRSAATRHERDEVRRLDAQPGPTPGTWRVRMPAVRGAIKLYALARDGAGNLAVATTSAALPLTPAEPARPPSSPP